MPKLERFGYTLLGFGGLAWFGVPIMKMLVFIVTGTNFGPQIFIDFSESPEPTNLGGRLFCVGILLIVGGAIAVMNGRSRR